MEQVIRCIRENDYTAIRDGKFLKGGQGMSVLVYYGFNNYHNSPTHVQMLAHIASTETNVDQENMHVHIVTREESIRHASHTMVQVAVDVERVKNNLKDYEIL